MAGKSIEDGVWRPPSRTLRNGVGVIVTAVFLASVALGVCSWRGRNYVAGVSVGRRLQVAGTYRGALGVGFTNIGMGRRFAGVARPSPEEMAQLRKAVEDNAVRSAQRLGFGYFAREGKEDGAFGIPGAQYVAVFVPLWLIALLSGIGAMQWGRGIIQRWRWGRLGRCRSCGYDLRAASSRCPECGRPATLT